MLSSALLAVNLPGSLFPGPPDILVVIPWFADSLTEATSKRRSASPPQTAPTRTSPTQIRSTMIPPVWYCMTASLRPARRQLDVSRPCRGSEPKLPPKLSTEEVGRDHRDRNATHLGRTGCERGQNVGLLRDFGSSLATFCGGWY